MFFLLALGDFPAYKLFSFHLAQRQSGRLITYKSDDRFQPCSKKDLFQ
jgi:hypothetical protein